jgi:hypothetical protein
MINNKSYNKLDNEYFAGIPAPHKIEGFKFSKDLRSSLFSLSIGYLTSDASSRIDIFRTVDGLIPNSR